MQVNRPYVILVVLTFITIISASNAHSQNVINLLKDKTYIDFPIPGEVISEIRDCQVKEEKYRDLLSVEKFGTKIKISRKSRIGINLRATIECDRTQPENPNYEIPLTVEANYVDTQIMIGGEENNEVQMDGFNLLKNQWIKFSTKDPIEIKIEDPSVATLAPEGSFFKLKALKKGSTVITVLKGDTVASKTEIPVTVEGDSVQGQITVKSQSGFDVAERFGIAKAFKPTIPIKYQLKYNTYDKDAAEPTLFTNSPKLVQGKQTIEIVTAVSHNYTGFEPALILSVMGNIVENVTFDIPHPNIELNKPISVKATGFNDLAQEVILTDVTWESSDKYLVAIEAANSNPSKIMAIKKPDGKHVVKVDFKLGDSSNVKGSELFLILNNAQVVDFKPIDVRIDLLDRRTGKDLFGGPAAKEYHIAKIRIVNDLNKYYGGGPASSILFFSDALEVKVALEKFPLDINKRKGIAPKWEPISKADIQYINNWRCSNSNNVNPSNATFQQPRPVSDNNEQLEKEIEKEKFDFCLNSHEGYYQIIPFRPFQYQITANTHDRRSDRSVRSMIFLGANLAGVGASFITSIAIPGASSDIPLGLEKYKNLLLPSMERLFPSMREVQRQNIISEVLPPLVEIPFGSDVSKYVFFPKREIYGVLPNYKVRIVSISSYKIKTRVALLQKQEVIQ